MVLADAHLLLRGERGGGATGATRRVRQLLLVLGRGGGCAGGGPADEKVGHGLVALALAGPGDGLLGAATHVPESNGLLAGSRVVGKTVNSDVVDVHGVAYLRR